MATLNCGQEITTDTTLDSDLTCASGPALIIAADNIVLDLAGHTISGDPKGGSNTPGILFRGVSGSTVRNGTVQHFGAGVALEGGARNVVQNITSQDNIGPDSGDFGDGIVVQDSKQNRIEGNTIVRNGPYSGISLLGASEHNVIRHNIVADNNMLQTGDPNAGRQDMGIRIEGPGASHNTVDSNTVTGSGADGITLLPVCLNRDSNPPCVGVPPNQYNRILNNTANGNGTSGRGDGVKVFSVPNPLPAAHSTIADNSANGNKEYGIGFEVLSTNNKAIRNSAHGNGKFDGFDGNFGCAANAWQSNDFGTVNQPCVGGQKSTAEDATPAWDPEDTKVDQPKVEAQFRKQNHLADEKA